MPEPLSELPQEIVPLRDIPRMTLEEARVLMNGFRNTNPQEFADAASMQRFNGFIDALTVLATNIFEHSQTVTHNGKPEPDLFQTSRTDWVQKTVLSVTTTNAAARLLASAANKDDQDRIMRQNTPTEISVATEDISKHTGFDNFILQIEIQTRFPGQRQETLFVNYIDDTNPPNRGIYFPPIYERDALKSEDYQTLARGLRHCAELVTSWESAFQQNTSTEQKPQLKLKPGNSRK